MLLENWASFATSLVQTSSLLMKVFITSASMEGLSVPAGASSQVPPQKWAAGPSQMAQSPLQPFSGSWALPMQKLKYQAGPKKHMVLPSANIWTFFSSSHTPAVRV